MDRGAREVDVVMPIGLVRAARYGEVVEHVHAAAALVHETGGLLKVIVEAGPPGPEETPREASLAPDGGAAFVQNLTGASAGGSPPPPSRPPRPRLDSSPRTVR